MINSNYLIKQLVLLIICLLSFSSLCRADNSSLSGYFEAGNRSQSEDFEEENEDREYAYQNYHLRFRDKPSDRLSYEFGTFIYDKDYKSKDSLDNISKIFIAKGSYYLDKQKTDSFKLDVTLK